MSLNFEKDGQMLWNPGMRVGRIFLSYVSALEPLVEQSAGIREVIDGDTYEVSGEEMRQFSEVLVDWYVTTNSSILRAMIEGVLRTCLILAERAGCPVEIEKENAQGLPGEREAFKRKISSEPWPMVM